MPGSIKKRCLVIGSEPAKLNEEPEYAPLRTLMNVVRIISLIWLAVCLVTGLPAVTLQIQITPKINGEMLQPASLRYQTAAGETYSITRVSWFASEFALQRPDGIWFTVSNSIAWLDYEQNRNLIRLENIPPENFCAVRFRVGLNPDLNHADPAKFPAHHPLNPNMNGLHWSWQGGYIFLAAEGLWRNARGELDGWSFHLARDTNSVMITVAAPFKIIHETRLELDFDLATLLNAPHPISFAKDGSSTHSRDGDPLAKALTGNLPGAFRIHRICSSSDTDIAIAHPQPLYLPAIFTPYEFKMSAIFPLPELPKDNPLTVARVELGKQLFYDKQLSLNNAQSCAGCHHPERAFTDGQRTARGAENKIGTRNAMALVNLAWKKEFFWDGRAKSLRYQVLQPIQNPIEMHETLTNLVTKLSRPIYPISSTAEGGGSLKPATPNTYPAQFAAAFGSPEITSEKIALALENYLLTLTSFNAKFDRVIRGEEKFSDEEQRGFQLFSTEYDPRLGQFGADCFHCHGGPLFQSLNFANNGLDVVASDLGRALVTGKAADAGKFAVPSLRNVALTAPYMHDGRFPTLEAVVRHYSTGVRRSATLDPNLAKHPDGGVPLDARNQRALVAFLRTLTDARFSVAD